MKLPAILACLLMATAAHAKAPAKTQFGPGATTCGAYVATPKNTAARLPWVLGYLSGLNAYAANVDFLAASDEHAVEAALKLYCQAHPLASLADGANSIYFQLIERVRKND